MTVDYTRDTFRRERGYSAVRLQQGRVSMDADWNEAVDINHHLARTTTGDVVGLTGMPEAAPGFEITPAPNPAPLNLPSDLLIGEGRAYVGGILVEHTGAPTTLDVLSGTGSSTTSTGSSGTGTGITAGTGSSTARGSTGPVVWPSVGDPTVWQVVSGPRLAVGQWLGPAADPRSNMVAVAAIERSQANDRGRQRLRLQRAFGTGPQTVRAVASLRVQPDLLAPEVPEAGASYPYYLAYLDVWEREITALEDPDIADVALGGVDTAARTKVIWQVKLLALDASLGVNPPMCKSFPAGWSPDGTAARIRLKAYVKVDPAQPNPCELPVQGGYRSLENHLYRVEVHRTAQLGGLRIKWSRDNATHRTRLLDVIGTGAASSLVVEDVGKDNATAIAVNDWLEVMDESRLLGGRSGYFVQVSEVVGTRLGIGTILDAAGAPVIQNGAPDAAVLPKQGIVRRWEKAPMDATGPLSLERGIMVEIQAGLAHVGDYWLIPARSLTAGIEWPTDPATGDAAPLPPRGVKHAYCPLALLSKTGTAGWTILDDCRPIFSPLTRMESFFYLGGDGQEARPDPLAPSPSFTRLDQALTVGVARGRRPIKGRPVRFRVTDAATPGRLAAVPGSDLVQSTPQQIVVRTDADGIAAVYFEINAARHDNRVVAELLDAGNNLAQASRVHLPITFTANTSVATEVAYNPETCSYQRDARVAPVAATTVQAAIDRLCPRLEFVPLGGDDQLLCVNQPAPAPIAVGLFWGRQPIQNAVVNFTVQGNATVNPPAAQTNSSGVATTTIQAGGRATANNGIVRITAIVGTPFAPSTPPSLVFTARFANAACVYADAGSGGMGVPQAFLDAAGSNTVAGLLDFLWGRSDTEPGIRALAVMRAKDPTDALLTETMQQNQLLAPELLVKGVRIELDAPAAELALRQQQAGAVEIDLPFPVASSDRQTWWQAADGAARQAVVGWHTVRLFGALAPAAPLREGAKGAIVWVPQGRAAVWLWQAAAGGAAGTSALEEALKKLDYPFQLPARLVLPGDRIWSEEQPPRFLDGELFAEPATPSPTQPHFPSGNGRRGGNLVFPFLVGRPIRFIDFDPIGVFARDLIRPR